MEGRGGERLAREMSYVQRMEQCLLTDMRKQIWRPFMRAVRDYRLLSPGDRIAVCISGGKDSMLMAKLMQMLHRHTVIPFEPVFLIMDPGYNPENRRLVEENAKKLEIPCTIFESDIFEVANAQEKNPCFLCARMRRGCLYGKAQELGCNKIALGHHFDDVVGTTALGMFYGGQLQAMAPKLKAKNFPGMELIRPMYLIHEANVVAWARTNDLRFIQCACRFTENGAHDPEGGGKRLEIKRLLKELKKTNPTIEDNIFASIHTLQLDTMVGWKYKGKDYSFLDGYDEE